MQKRYYFSKIILVSHYFYQIMIMFRPLCPQKKKKKNLNRKRNKSEKEKEKQVGLEKICVRNKEKN